VTDLRSKSLIIDSVLAQFATKHNLRFSGAGVSDVKTVTSHATATIQGLERIATALSLASSDADLIAVSVRKLRRENEELNTELDSVARLSGELERCKDGLADAERSAADGRMREQALAASRDQARRALADLQLAFDESRDQANAEADGLRAAKSKMKGRADKAKAENERLLVDAEEFRSTIAALEGRGRGGGGGGGGGLAEDLAAAEAARRDADGRLAEGERRRDEAQNALRQSRAQVADLETQRDALAGQLETKTAIIQSYESQVKSLRESNEKFRSQSLTRSLQLEVSQLTSENRELQRKLVSAAGQASDLQRANADLDDRVAELQAENRTLSQASDVKASLASTLRDQNAELSLKLSELEESQVAQTDVRLLERQNRRLTSQLQEVELEAVRKDAEIARLQRSPRRGEVEAVVGRIEETLEKFQLGQARRPETVLAWLEGVLTAIAEVADLFEEQKRSLTRIAGSLPRRIRASPR
jgi:chromosome segregation ATPase